MLDAAKKFQTGKFIPGQEDEIISKMKAALEKLGADVPETGTLSLLSDTLGKALTEFSPSRIRIGRGRKLFETW